MVATLNVPRRTGLIAAAAVVAVVAAASVVWWGLIPLPTFPSLQAEPDASIAGEVAYLTDDGTPRSCVVVLAASGATQRELRCYDDRDGAWVEQVTWTADGDLVVTWYGAFGPEYEVLDPATGEIIASGTSREVAGAEFPEPLRPGGSGDGIGIQHPGGRTVVTVRIDGEERVVLDVEGPRSYRVDDVRWAPDRLHLLALDSEQRVLVLDVQANAPRLLVDGARSATWWIAGYGADRVVDVPDG